MRYLDSEPREGDRVHVEFEGAVGNIDTSARVANVRVDTGTAAEVPFGDWFHWVQPSWCRVIAPEPAVGGVVTEDMDLPEGSIVECGTEGVTAKRLGEHWFIGTDPRRNLVVGMWRIVRIGGTP